MKRIVTYMTENERNIVRSISAPIHESKIDIEKLLEDGYGIIDANYINPPSIEGQKMTLYYNIETQTIEVEYSDIEFEDLPAIERLSYLKEKTNSLLLDNDSLLHKVDDLKNENNILNETINSMKQENESLKSELELTQLSLFELVDMMLAE